MHQMQGVRGLSLMNVRRDGVLLWQGLVSVLDGLMGLFARHLTIDSDPEVRLAVLALLDNIVQWFATGSAPEETALEIVPTAAERELFETSLRQQALHIFVSCIAPNMIWRAGLVAATIRYVSCCLLLTACKPVPCDGAP